MSALSIIRKHTLERIPWLGMQCRLHGSALAQYGLASELYPQPEKENGLHISHQSFFFNFLKDLFIGQAVVVHAFNPSTWEAESGRFLSSRPAWSTSEFQDSQSYTEKRCLEKQNKTKQNKTKQNKGTLFFAPGGDHRKLPTIKMQSWEV